MPQEPDHFLPTSASSLALEERCERGEERKEERSLELLLVLQWWD